MGLWLFLVADRNIVNFVSKIWPLSSGLLGKSNCSELISYLLARGEAFDLVGKVYAV